MAPDTTRQHRPKVFWIGVLLAATLLTLLAGWLNRAQILRLTARAWIISDSVASAEVIVVLGGGVKTRPLAAMELDTVDFVPFGGAWQEIHCGPPTCVDLNRAVLLKFGVPPEAIVGFGTGNSSTYEEAHELAAWARANGVRSIIVPTEIFSARRVRFILN
jgi:uncharacterized SAM-binding protein YcdF (DUF218 family)